MKLELLELSLVNFKGIKQMTVRFDDVTTIVGPNRSGKTTIKDAWNWLLTGKDSSDRENFSIKTLDQNNRPFHRLDHEVGASIRRDGSVIRLRRVFKEKWVKPVGESTQKLEGHLSEFYIDDVPKKKSEYMAFINELVSDEVSKLLTSPLYFNSDKFGWESRRNILLKLAGNKSDDSILRDMEADHGKPYGELKSIRESGKSFEEWVKQHAIQKRKISDRLDEIGPRIDEAERSRPEALDYAKLEAEIAEKEREIAAVNDRIDKKSDANRQLFDQQQQVRNEINDLRNQANNIRRSADTDRSAALADFDRRIADENIKMDEIDRLIRDKKRALTQNRESVDANNSEITRKKVRIATINEEIDNLRVKWREINAEQLHIDPAELACPTCQREFDHGRIEEIQAGLVGNFNKNKQARISDNIESGKKNMAEIDKINDSINRLCEENEASERHAKEIETAIDSHNEDRRAIEKRVDGIRQEKINYQNIPPAPDPRIATLEAQAAEKEANLPTVPVLDNTAERNEIAAIRSRIDEIKKKLNTRDEIKRVDDRVRELTEEEARLAQEKADIEQTEFAIQTFEKYKMGNLENTVNGMFSIVKFKLFRELVNEGEKACCECTVNGVPFHDLNTAMKINAGIDIINTISEYMDIYVPLFIDNAESVNQIIRTRSQIIKMYVVEPEPENETEKGEYHRKYQDCIILKSIHA